MAEDRLLQRRESRHLRGGGRNQKGIASNILEVITRLSGGDAAAEGRRMKFTVKKEDLKLVLEAIRDTRRRGSAAAEQRLNSLRRRQILRAASQGKSGSRLGTWSPVLQSIPEEL